MMEPLLLFLLVTSVTGASVIFGKGSMTEDTVGEDAEVEGGMKIAGNIGHGLKMANITDIDIFCSEAEFACDNGNCIMSRYKCDDDNDCGDWSDEKDCHCTNGQLTCANGRCMTSSRRCDGVDDCGDGSDEWQCHLIDLPVMDGSCANSTAVCENGATCTDLTGQGFVCECGQGFAGRTCGSQWAGECTKPCEGVDCQRLKTKMAGLLDMNVDPCEDFFRFACNVATRGNQLPPDKKKLLELADLVKKPPMGFEYVKKFYQSCTRISMGFTTLEVLRECAAGGCTDAELNPYGRIYIEFMKYLKTFAAETAFPAVTPNWEEVTKNWFRGYGWTWWDFAANVLKDNFYLGTFQYSVRPRLNSALGVDVFRPNLFFVPMIDTTIDLAQYKEGDLLPRIYIVPMRVSGFLRNGGNTVLVNQYKDIMRLVLQLMSNNATTLEKDMERIVELELELGQINNKSEFRTDDTWEIVTLKELHKLVPTVPWQDYIQAVLTSNPTFRVGRETEVSIPSKTLMIKMGEWVRRMELVRRDQANLLAWRMLIIFANNFMHTGLDEDDLQENIFLQIDGNAKFRSKNCITQIKTFFPGVEDDMLIAQYVNEDQRKAVNRMFQELKEEFALIIDESNWMMQRTKLRAKEKLIGTKLVFGQQLTPMTDEYRHLKASISLDYIGNIISISNYTWDTQAKNLEKEKPFGRVDQEENNARYLFEFNEVHVKIGLIRELLDLGLSMDFPPSILYGSFVASTLGHELTHGFDNSGRKYEKNGYLLDWWEEKDKEAFDNRTQCLVDQYSNFKIPYRGTNYTISGGRAGENIADNGGTRLAYRAFQRLQGHAKDECVPGLPFTANQIFWLGYAMDWCLLGGQRQSIPTYEGLLGQPVSRAGHSPAPWRVNVVVSNQPEFARDFQCPAGAALQGGTCGVW